MYNPDTGSVKIADFGLSSLIPLLPRRCEVAGTMPYL